MKKFLILCLVAALLLVGCNKQTSSEPELTPVTDPATDPVTDPAQTSGSAENDPNRSEAAHV